MKKALNTMLIVIAILLAFVACSPQEAVSDELVSATLVSTDRSTRSLDAEVDFDLSAVKLWKYTAAKADNGLSTGATGTGTENAKELNDDGTTGGLSQGAWNFVLYGYDAAENGKLIAQGSINNATVTTSSHDVTITVKPVQTAGAKGKIAIASDIKIESTDGSITYETGSNGYILSYAVYKTSDTEKKNKITNLESIDVGSYNVVITFKGTVNGSTYDAATATKTVNVYAGLTTTVKGTIKETEQAATIKREGSYVDIKSQSVTSDTINTGLTMTANASPVGTTATTEITFPASSLFLDSGSEEVKLTIVATPVETATTTYAVTDNGTAVAGFDLKLEGAEIAESSLSDDNGIKITTKIATGLGSKDDLAIVYNGKETEGQKSAQIVSYDSASGELVFMVYHFSEYYIKTKVNIAYDEDSLRNAIQKASTGETATEIKIINDISLGGTLVINGGKKVKIDLNGHTVSAGAKPFTIENANVEFTGKGVIQETENNGYAPILLKGSITDVADYTVVTVGSEIELKGWMGVFITNSIDSAGKSHAYGVVVNLNGTKITAPAEESHKDGGGLYINGNIADLTGNVPTINMANVTINAREAGFYAAGYAEWDLKNCTITSNNAFSIKSGKITIDGGTYKSTGEFKEPGVDDSNGSVDTGAVISLTSNKGYPQKLDVIVKDGTFESVNGYAVYEGIPTDASSGTPVSLYSYVTLDIQGGTFNGNSEKAAIKLTNLTNKKVVKAGTFNSNPGDYLAEGSTASESNGIWTVTKSASEGVD